MQTAKLETNFTVLKMKIVLDQVNIELSIGIGFSSSQANVADTNLYKICWPHKIPNIRNTRRLTLLSKKIHTCVIGYLCARTTEFQPSSMLCIPFCLFCVLFCRHRASASSSHICSDPFQLVVYHEKIARCPICSSE